ncbi:YhcN/YlaJ family sporulation lipoprotein [Sporosarcina koreensis]|uniref:YhcN/YlaJ family sporulation lipoprotein n=1 Tax=Sporosarcina koreensis TaxID=334735 RepID=UPI000693FEEF|nr:YhcN/YlaJ family sporulation lipoprotein [Sporosarcina koreensis]
MKKLMMLLAACLLMASLAACGKKDNANNGTADNNTDTTGQMDKTDETDDMADDDTTAGTDTDADMDTENGDSAADDQNNVETSDDIAEAVKSIDGVDHANVLKMNDTLYVGATLKEGTNSTTELDGQIADKAREDSDDADKVYVSTNPDFAKEIDEYSDKIRNGEPVQGLFEEIGDAMSRMFPDAH